MSTTMSEPTGTGPNASRGRIENERQVSEMATTKTATKTTKPTKTTRPAATKRATPTKTATPKAASGRKKLEEMTDEEIGLLAWETSYKNRHKRLDQ